MKTKPIFLFVALTLATSLFASDVITYTATEKLLETIDSWNSGLHTDAFNVSISSHTFSNGTGTITFSGEVTTIGNYAFAYCSGLTSVTIPNSVTTIGERAFEFCEGLTSLTIGNSVTTIGNSAFSWCIKLTSITIPNSVTTIGGFAFYCCSGLTSVTIPNSVTTIGGSAFQYCSGLTSVTIPASVTTIEGGTFFGCSGLTSVTIPNSVTEIGNSAFYECSGLTSVTIPNSVTTIGEEAFFECSRLTSITIPNSVTTIGDYAFFWCSGLTSVTIGNSVTEIGLGAFNGCSGLTSVTIPNSVTTIGEEAFNGCSGLTSVTIPNSVTTIGEEAFGGCRSLTSVTIPNSVTSIGENAFNRVNNIVYNGTATGSPWGAKCLNGYVDGYLVYSDTIKTKLCGCFTAATGEIVIPSSVTTIGANAFEYCRGLTSITCYATNPPTCGSYCFNGVNKTIPVYVPARSVNVYKRANDWRDFYNLQGFPNDYAIVTCSATNGTIKGGGKYIKGDTCTLTVTPSYGYHFTQWNDGNTDNPRSFIVTQDTTFIAQIDTAFSGQCGDDLTWRYNDGVLVISGTGAMYDYAQGTAPWMLFFQESISSLVINNGCTTIGNYAFYGLSNKNLKTIDIPNGVEQIGQFAFANCEYIKNVYLGLSLEKISANAFANDERLLYITCFAIEPPLLDESAFVNYDVYLSVPCESQNEYKVAKGWKLFNKENVSCIGAEEKPITGDEVTVTPSTDNATIVWPANDDAAEYKLVITKDGIVFCTLTFNAQGQLTGIAFAPNRNGSRMLDAAVMTANGWQFTVTGLDQACKYGYTIDALNASKQSIKHYEGEFATDGYTSLEWVTSDHIQGMNKMLLNGHLYILRDGNLYTATGVRVK
ncbi:MAG: leucine-rich repeat domain-containing protein [Bacteroidales bacterium]|nr:leucine-rich repeat domain-containing protein [Candidatus Colicola equi]